jgi:PKD repeat protein
MGERNKPIGVRALVRTGLVILAAAIALLLTWAGVVAGSVASSENPYKADPQFVKLSDGITPAIVAANGGESIEDVALSTAVAAETTLAPSGGVLNTLRVYGRLSEDAAFPYATGNYTGPFGLANSEAPSKDFVQFNPAIMFDTDDDSLGGFGQYFRDAIKAGLDAHEKVHLRMWYVPEYPEPRGLTFPRVSPVNNAKGDIVLEYTYMLLDASTLNPQTGPLGSTRMVFPMAGLDGQPGLDRMDVDGDGNPETLSIDGIVGLVTGTLSAPGVTLGIPDNQKTTHGIIEVSAREVLAPVRVSEGEQVEFLDYMVRLEGVSFLGLWADVSIWYIGNDTPSLLGIINLPLGSAALAGRFWAPSVQGFATGADAEAAAVAAMLATDLPARPFWVTLDSIVEVGGETYARLTPHRLLMTGETFFVDYVEYDVAAILVEDTDLTVGEVAPEIKYITLRNPLPKGDDVLWIPDLTVGKRRISQGGGLWVLPPFNYEHDMVDDVNIPEISNGLDPDEQWIDNDSAVQTYVANAYDLIEERVVRDVPALTGDLSIRWIVEDKEERFDTNLLEEKFVQEQGVGGWDEEWRWINIETRPWHYTEFILPKLPDKPTRSGYTTGDYVLVSSFLTEDSITTIHGAGAVRMKFAYDRTNGLGIYVDPRPDFQGGVFRGRVKLQSAATRALTLTARVVEDGSVILNESVPTDESGYFSLELDPGTYSVWVQEEHSLAKPTDDVVITSGITTEFDFGELLVGDANGDNLVDLRDFGVWKSILLNTADLRADFNLDGQVTSLDFGWVKENFGKQGDDPLAGPLWEANSSIRLAQPSTVTVYLDPATSNVTPSETFTVAIKVAAGTAEVDSADVFVDFDPMYLAVTDITGSEVLNESGRSWDNDSGEVFFGVADLNKVVSGTFTLATMAFQAGAAPVAGTLLTFNTEPPRKTTVNSGVTPLSLEAESATVQIRGLVVSIEPPSRTVCAGDTFTLGVKVEARAQQLDGVQAYVDFDPVHLQATEMNGGGVLPTEMLSSYDNVSGHINYAAADETGTVSGTFTLATITFHAVTETAGAPTLLSFHVSPPRETLVILGETTLSSTLNSGQVVITEVCEPISSYAYLPIVLRSHAPPHAGFTASPTSGPAPLTVDFTNTSTGNYTDVLWDFGDGITSTQASPTHTYTLTGTYTVTLTVSQLTGSLVRPGDSSTLVRPNYIIVFEEGTPQPPSDLRATAISWTGIRLDWQDNSDDETGFTIYDGTGLTGFTDVPSNTTSYTDTGLAPGSYHCYYVFAFNEHGDSDLSDWACATTFECDQGITNGGFEDDSSWVIPETPYPAAYTTAITHAGNRSMRAGIAESADNDQSYSSFRQTVTIPSDVVSATLRFWLYRVSGEPPYTPTLTALPLDVGIEEATLVDDLQYVVVLNEYDQEIRRLVSQRIDDQQWTSYEFDMGVHVGKTIKLHFGVYNDGVDGVTAMYVDDVSLNLCGSSADRRLNWRQSRRALNVPIGLEASY